MSAIPPNWLTSITGAPGAQQRTSEARAREQAAQADRAQPSGNAEKRANLIQEADQESEVFADAEGTGSQGRPFEEPSGQTEQPPDDGSGADSHLDVQA